MNRFKLNVNGNWYEIEIKDLDQSPISVLVNGKPYEVELGSETPSTEAVRRVGAEPEIMVSEPEPAAGTPSPGQPVSGSRGAAAAAGEVIAPMPGKILAVHVGVGDRVQPQDVLCTLEAMKMKNEIMSPAAGVVKEIGVIEGQDVMYGDVLLVIG
jgi:pyruvate carboxylase subunit B